jgi:hypothetical protein
MNLDLMSNHNLSNEQFCDLAVENRIKIKELASLYKSRRYMNDSRTNFKVDRDDGKR